MAVEQLIARGDLALDKKDFLSAIDYYSKAIKENSKAYAAYLKRSIAYQRFKNYERAKVDISEAFALAHERGRREEIADCYFRLAVVHYNEKQYVLALKNWRKAKKYGCKEPALDTWLLKSERDVAKTHPDGISDSEEEEEETPKKADQKPAPSKGAKEPESDKQTVSNATKPTESNSTSIDAINKHAPLKVKTRDDWYQNNDEIVITIYAKSVNKDALKVEYNTRSVTVSFPSGPGSEYNYNLDPLFADIDAEKSSHSVKSTKIEITLVKKEPVKWKSLEGSSSSTVSEDTTNESSLQYPTSAKKSINWANFNVDEDGNEEESDDPNAFFAKLYKDVDDDTRRAMMKSYVESNGTELTTNWEEAKKKSFETSPPEGMQAKKW